MLIEIWLPQPPALSQSLRVYEVFCVSSHCKARCDAEPQNLNLKDPQDGQEERSPELHILRINRQRHPIESAVQLHEVLFEYVVCVSILSLITRGFPITMLASVLSSKVVGFIIYTWFSSSVHNVSKHFRVVVAGWVFCLWS